MQNNFISSGNYGATAVLLSVIGVRYLGEVAPCSSCLAVSYSRLAIFSPVALLYPLLLTSPALLFAFLPAPYIYKYRYASPFLKKADYFENFLIKCLDDKK